jgi:hypothetical protein
MLWLPEPPSKQGAVSGYFDAAYDSPSPTCSPLCHSPCCHPTPPLSPLLFFAASSPSLCATHRSFYKLPELIILVSGVEPFGH